MHVQTQAQTQAQTPQSKTVPAKVNCVATNYPEVLVHKNADGTTRLEDVEDWRVNCTITLGDKKLFGDDLLLPHPTPFREAMDAIDSFRTKQAPKIVKSKEKS